ncbi:MAG TPA: TlpA family protein disulfide reductase, partial [Sphingomonadaceae bacterium]|nr:TlpA family protein disulfide reductase [Sphingomonadaceae bacterium]
REYRLGFPIAVDRPDGQGLPHTMAAYGLEGTPSLVLIDRQGRIRKQSLGAQDDMAVGAEIGLLLGEKDEATA